jgi:glycosyltransferase involved in cell wall biosynthesis
VRSIETFRLLLAASARSAQLSIFPSQGCCDDFVEHFGSHPERTIPLPNPIDLQNIERQSQLDAEHALPEGKGPTFISVGRLEQQKNHKHLLNACAILKEKAPEFSVVLLGEGSERAAIEAHAKALGLDGQVHLLGVAANPYPYIRNADALVLSSDFESFALVLLEAMVCDTLAISVDCPSGPREVIAGGKAGLLVPPNDPRALAEAMAKVTSAAAQLAPLIQAGRKHARLYDANTIADRWGNLLYEGHGAYRGS